MNSQNLFSRISSAIRTRFKQSALSAITENDDTFYGGRNMSSLYRDRYDYDRQKVLSETLRAWRVNPLARRIVNLISQFAIGKGIDFDSENAQTRKFLAEWSSHPLNNIPQKLKSWMDELTRSGNLFFLVTVGASNTAYIRAVPADSIKEIKSAENDIEQELSFIPQNFDLPPFEAYDPVRNQTEYILHFAVNRPVGSAWGEPDLAPLLPWIGRFSAWLEDRARLNRFRNAFMYIVRGQFKTPAEKKARQNELNANPPRPGSILVTDSSEDWGILSANLDSFDATLDGLALKKMIAAGIGIPLHYLAEPESATSTTAEAAGTPTFRSLQEIQQNFAYILKSLALNAIEVKNRDLTRKLKPQVSIKLQDISERDNPALALAASRIYASFADMFDRQLITEADLLNITYRMAGESWTEKKVTGLRRPLTVSEPIKPEPEKEPTENKENE